MQCGSLDWILEQKMSISEKTGEIRIKSVVNNTVSLVNFPVLKNIPWLY